MSKRCFKFNTTYCTVLCGGACSICTSFVAKSSNGLLSYENLVTYRAVLTFGKTGGCASCCYCFVNYFGMALGSNCDCFTAEFFAANGTVYYIVIRAVIYTISGFVIFNNDFAFGVTKF